MNKRRAEFIGVQEGYEEIESFPLFNIINPEDPRDGSTVTQEELKEMGIEIPKFKGEI